MTDLKHGMYKLTVVVDVIAENRGSAENLVCKILDQAFVYGVGLQEYAEQARQCPTDVNRIFDYEIVEGKE